MYLVKYCGILINVFSDIAKYRNIILIIGV